MCEKKTVLVCVCLILLVTASFCKNWVHSEKKSGTTERNQNTKSLRTKYKDKCLNVEYYYVLDEAIVGCVCSWLYERRGCEKQSWWTKLKH